jgi:hypothetical protein
MLASLPLLALFLVLLWTYQPAPELMIHPVALHQAQLFLTAVISPVWLLLVRWSQVR